MPTPKGIEIVINARLAGDLNEIYTAAKQAFEFARVMRAPSQLSFIEDDSETVPSSEERSNVWDGIVPIHYHRGYLCAMAGDILLLINATDNHNEGRKRGILVIEVKTISEAIILLSSLSSVRVSERTIKETREAAVQVYLSGMTYHRADIMARARKANDILDSTGELFIRNKWQEIAELLGSQAPASLLRLLLKTTPAP